MLCLVFFLQGSKRKVRPTKKSMETKSLTWFFRNDLNVGDGGLRGRAMYFPTVDFATQIPSLPSSPRMRGDPQVGLAVDIFRISSRTLLSIWGRPGSEFLLSRLQ